MIKKIKAKKGKDQVPKAARPTTEGSQKEKDQDMQPTEQDMQPKTPGGDQDKNDHDLLSKWTLKTQCRTNRMRVPTRSGVKRTRPIGTSTNGHLLGGVQVSGTNAIGTTHPNGMYITLMTGMPTMPNERLGKMDPTAQMYRPRQKQVLNLTPLRPLLLFRHLEEVFPGVTLWKPLPTSWAAPGQVISLIHCRKILPWQETNLLAPISVSTMDRKVKFKSTQEHEDKKSEEKPKEVDNEENAKEGEKEGDTGEKAKEGENGDGEKRKEGDKEEAMKVESNQEQPGDSGGAPAQEAEDEAERARLEEIEERRKAAHARYMRYFRNVRSINLSLSRWSSQYIWITCTYS